MDIHPHGIAIGIPGEVDIKNGIAVDADNLATKNLPITHPIASRFQMPTYLFHDVRSAVLGEALYGAGAGCHNFAFLNIGTGIAIGLYLNGQVHHGAHHLAGEIGHICLSMCASSPTPPANDLLEAYASGPAMVRRAREALAEQPHSLISQFSGEMLGDLSPMSIQKAAQAGDPLAVQLVAETADRLGAAIGMVQDILDLECIILGGGVAQMGALLLEPIRTALARYAIQPVPVLITPLGGEVGVIGVAAAYFQKGGSKC